MGDAGLTGRKIIVDTYGGMARHGGGAFSGKDPTKVDRLGSLRGSLGRDERRRRGSGDRFEIELAYTIGVAHPVSVSIETYGTEKVSDEKLLAAIQKNFDLRPSRHHRSAGFAPADLPADSGIRHFGRSDHDFPWERTNKRPRWPTRAVSRCRKRLGTRLRVRRHSCRRRGTRLWPAQPA